MFGHELCKISLMRNYLLLLLVILCGCSRAEVPNAPLLRIESEWAPPEPNMRHPARSADASIVIFRQTGDFIENFCRVLERADGTLYLSARHPHVVAVGKWKRSWSKITATRERVTRTTPAPPGPKDPLCENPEVKFVISRDAIVSRVTGDRRDPYEQVDRLVAPDLMSYENNARISGTPCEKEE